MQMVARCALFGSEVLLFGPLGPGEPRAMEEWEESEEAVEKEAKKKPAARQAGKCGPGKEKRKAFKEKRAATKWRARVGRPTRTQEARKRRRRARSCTRTRRRQEGQRGRRRASNRLATG